MHAHGVEIFDGADDDAIVLVVTDHLHLVFLPAEYGLLDQQFMGGGQLQSALADLDEFLTVVGNAATGTPQREGGADDGGIAGLLQTGQRLLQGMRNIG